jgi:hypothetical protein
MMSRKLLALALTAAVASLALASVPAAPAAPAASPSTSRQTGLAGLGGPSGILSAIGSMFPSMMGNMLPLVLLFGLGALMVPALGLGLLLREGRRSDHPYYYRSFPSFNINTSAIVDGMSDVFERVMKALDNVEKKY